MATGINRLGSFFKSLGRELKRVSWPSFKETMKKTWVVILMVLVVAVIIGLFDALAGGVINALINLFS